MIVSRFKSPAVGAITVIAAALAIAWLWLLIMGKASYWTTLFFGKSYHLQGAHLASCVFLIVTGLVYHRWIAPLGIGRITLRASIAPAIAMFALYTTEHAYNQLTGQPVETWMIDLLNQPFWPLLTTFIVILTVVPLGEEILFRGVLLNVFRTTGRWTIWIGIAVIAIIFAKAHSQYQNLSTLLEMAAVSVICSWARLRSDGLALPVLLHIFAAILAVVYTWFGL